MTQREHSDLLCIISVCHMTTVSLEIGKLNNRVVILKVLYDFQGPEIENKSK